MRTLKKYLFKQYHHNSHNRVSNTLAKKRKLSKYNTMKACDGKGLRKYIPYFNRPRDRYLFIHECNIYNYPFIPHI